jgi:hypothetical protein
MYSDPGKTSKFSTIFSSKPTHEIYWPSLIDNDANFASVDIFMAGFETAVDAGKYDLAQCANQVYGKLAPPRSPSKEAITSRKNLIFVGHSTGGIVARYLLTRNEPAFLEKNVGVVLIASPSIGSIYADRFDLLTRIYANELGGVLRRDSTLLGDLDERFAEFVAKKKKHIPNLTGAEACEHRLILRRKLFGSFDKWLPPAKNVIVDPDSAGRYFRPVTMIADSDHFSIVKPPAVTHETHDFLYRFWYEFQQELLAKAPGTGVQAAPDLAPPPSSEKLIGRDHLFLSVKQKLLAGESCALYGAADIGKTALAVKLANDAELRAQFPDGVLWDSLSNSKQASGMFSRWSEALNMPRAVIAGLKRTEDVANEVDQRKMLIVCDDCDTQEDALLVRMIGPNCARLLTTRDATVARSFAGTSGAVEIGLLEASDAAELLKSFAPSLGDSETSGIVQQFGGNPGQIKLLGGTLAGIKDPARRKDMIRRLSAEVV